jgi:tRNA G18 (ribose-2'-O)-methylase SpoU
VAVLAGWAADEGLPLVGVDNVEGSVPAETYDLPQRCVLLLGQEGPGLSAPALAACDVVVAVTQYGSTRSLNAGAAAAVVMHAWVRRHVFGQRP